jgi:alpha-beta hydrolase superfamily lysophospholipase
MAEKVTKHDQAFTDDHGVEVFYHRWTGTKKPSGVIHLVHGLGEHLFRYEPLITTLVRSGFEVWGHHQRGHGLTGLGQWGDPNPSWGKLGPGGMEAVLSNTRDVTRMAREANPDKPVFFLGHSWGSLVGQILLNRGFADLIDGVIFTGTSYRMPGWMNSGDLNKKHQHLGTTGAEWLSRDTAVHEAFAEDPWTFEAKTLELFGVADSAKLIGRPKAVGKNIPLLLMVGSDDSLGGERGTRKLAESYRSRGGLTDITVRVYEGARHEVFNETNRDEVISDLLDWLRGKLKASTA